MKSLIPYEYRPVIHPETLQNNGNIKMWIEMVDATDQSIVVRNDFMDYSQMPVELR